MDLSGNTTHTHSQHLKQKGMVAALAQLHEHVFELGRRLGARRKHRERPREHPLVKLLLQRRQLHAQDELFLRG